MVFSLHFQQLFTMLNLLPDCKIYINSFATVDVLMSSTTRTARYRNFEQHAIQLPFNEGRSLPLPQLPPLPGENHEDPPPLRAGSFH